MNMHKREIKSMMIVLGLGCFCLEKSPSWLMCMCTTFSNTREGKERDFGCLYGVRDRIFEEVV